MTDDTTPMDEPAPSADPTSSDDSRIGGSPATSNADTIPAEVTAAETALKAALAGRAATVRPSAASLPTIESAIAARRRSSRLRVVGALGAGIAACLAIVMLVTADDPTGVETGPADGGVIASTTTTTSRTGPPTTASDWAGQEFVYPLDGPATDRVELVGAFARDYLGMADPVVYAPGSRTTASTVNLLPTPIADDLWTVTASTRGGPVTYVEIMETDGGFAIVSALSSTVFPSFFAPGPYGYPELPDDLGFEFPLRGTSSTFEGNVAIEVRSQSGQTLVETFATGGSMGEMRPFETTVTVPPIPMPSGADGKSIPIVLIVGEKDMSGEGDWLTASVVPLRLDPGTEPPSTTTTTGPVVPAQTPPPTPPPSSTTSTSTSRPTANILEASTVVATSRWHGGMCMIGNECAVTITIRADGSWSWSDGSITDTGEIDQTLVLDYLTATVEHPVGEVDLEPFTEECPTSYDGQKQVVTVRDVNGRMVTLASCEVVLDFTVSPLRELQAMLTPITATLD